MVLSAQPAPSIPSHAPVLVAAPFEARGSGLSGGSAPGDTPTSGSTRGRSGSPQSSGNHSEVRPGHTEQDGLTPLARVARAGLLDQDMDANSMLLSQLLARGLGGSSCGGQSSEPQPTSSSRAQRDSPSEARRGSRRNSAADDIAKRVRPMSGAAAQMEEVTRQWAGSPVPVVAGQFVHACRKARDVPNPTGALPFFSPGDCCLCVAALTWCCCTGCELQYNSVHTVLAREGMREFLAFEDAISPAQKARYRWKPPPPREEASAPTTGGKNYGTPPDAAELGMRVVPAANQIGPGTRSLDNAKRQEKWVLSNSPKDFRARLVDSNELPDVHQTIMRRKQSAARRGVEAPSVQVREPEARLRARKRAVSVYGVRPFHVQARQTDRALVAVPQQRRAAASHQQATALSGSELRPVSAMSGSTRSTRLDEEGVGFGAAVQATDCCFAFRVRAAWLACAVCSARTAG